MKSWKWIFSYAIAASLGLWLALVLSLHVVRPAHSQTPPPSQAPSNGDLPPEFLNETSGSGGTPTPPPAQTPAPSSSPAPGAAATPAPTPPSAPATTAGDRAQEGAAVGSPEAPAANPDAENESETVTAPPPRISSGGDDFVYDPTGRRDPFKPYKTLLMGPPKPGPAVQNTPRETIPVEPLQRWDVERLKVIGILWEVHAPKAMLQDPEGGIYTVMKNTKVGRYNGYVAAIREGEVVVIETYDNEGQIQKATKVLELGK